MDWLIDWWLKLTPAILGQVFAVNLKIFAWDSVSDVADYDVQYVQYGQYFKSYKHLQVLISGLGGI